MHRKKFYTLIVLILSLLLTLLAACSQQADAPATPEAVEAVEAVADEPAQAAAAEAPPAEEIILRVDMSVDTVMENILEPFIKQFEAETGSHVEFVRPPETGGSNIDKLTGLQHALNSGSSQIDVYEIDIIWSDVLAEYALDMSEYLSEAGLGAYVPAVLENYTVDGKLVALPMYGDVGLLFYRADLLGKYGFDGPPATWDELEEMAAVIQAGERTEGNDEFWGFVWQGVAYEGLTCEALEWQVSHDGGQIIEPDGTITVNNPDAIAAFERAAGWIGVISPAEIIDYDDFVTRSAWINGNAAFMRSWPFLWHPDIHNALIEGRDGVTVLPTADAQHAATLGGWGLMASKYSQHPDLAAKFVALMSSPEVQKQRALDGDLPTIEALYHDPDVLAAKPFMADVLPVLQSAVARPSTVTGAQYAEVSAAYYNHVHSILAGEVSAAEGVANLEAELVDITGFEARMP